MTSGILHVTAKMGLHEVNAVDFGEESLTISDRCSAGMKKLLLCGICLVVMVTAPGCASLGEYTRKYPYWWVPKLEPGDYGSWKP